APVSTRLGDGRAHRVEDRSALDVLAALAGGYARDDVRAVRTVSQPVKAALAPRQALDDEPRLHADQDAHAGRARKAIRSSAIHPSEMWGAISTRTRPASSPVHAVRASHGSSSIGKSKARV